MGNIRHGLPAYAMGNPDLECWEDLRFPATGINLPGAGGEPTRDATTGYLEFPATGTTTIAIHPQMPHAWKQGSVVRPHVHWRKKTAGAGDVVWQLEYEWTDVWEVATDSYTTLTVSEVAEAGRDDGTAKRHLLSSFGEIDMTGFKVSVMGMLRLSRLGNDAADTYGGVVQLKEIDIHYLVDSLGSEQLYTKA